MNGLMDGNHRCHCQNKAQKTRERPRHLHQSTLSFGDAAPSYTTTFSQSYSGRGADGRPLVFQRREPSFPSQHHTWLDLGDSTPPCSPLRSHTQEVHGSKQDAARENQAVRTRPQRHSGQFIREVMNPQGPCEYRTTYTSEHTLPATDGSSQRPGGLPAQWHRHNILTGEETQAAGPGTPRRRSRDGLMWDGRQAAARQAGLRQAAQAAARQAAARQAAARQAAARQAAARQAAAREAALRQAAARQAAQAAVRQAAARHLPLD